MKSVRICSFTVYPWGSRSLCYCRRIPAGGCQAGVRAGCLVLQRAIDGSRQSRRIRRQDQHRDSELEGESVARKGSSSRVFASALVSLDRRIQPRRTEYATWSVSPRLHRGRHACGGSSTATSAVPLAHLPPPSLPPLWTTRLSLRLGPAHLAR